MRWVRSDRNDILQDKEYTGKVDTTIIIEIQTSNVKIKRRINTFGRPARHYFAFHPNGNVAATVSICSMKSRIMERVL